MLAQPAAHGVTAVAHERGGGDLEHQLRAGGREGPQQPADLSAEPAARHQHEPLAQLRVLVGELHGDPAAEGLADDGDAVHVEGGEQVAQAAGVGPEGVVAGRLGGLAVAGQVGGEDPVVLRQVGHDVAPGGRAPGHAVDQQDRLALAHQAVGDVVAVDEGMRGSWHPRQCAPAGAVQKGSMVTGLARTWPGPVPARAPVTAEAWSFDPGAGTARQAHDRVRGARPSGCRPTEPPGCPMVDTHVSETDAFTLQLDATRSCGRRSWPSPRSTTRLTGSD